MSDIEPWSTGAGSTGGRCGGAAPGHVAEDDVDDDVAELAETPLEANQADTAEQAEKCGLDDDEYR